jgi:hypothetical protein
MSPSFEELVVPTLVVAGDKDDSPLSTRGPDWFLDAYNLSPGAEALLTLFDGEHSLGGITGYRVTDTTDESPDRVAAVQKVTTAYLLTVSNSKSNWSNEVMNFNDHSGAVGKINQKES